MLLIKFFNSANLNKVFKVNNYGNHFRDFTYINDVIKIVEILIKIKIKKKHTILNICSSKPLKLIYVINKLSKITSFKKIKKIRLNNIEVLKTYGDNTKLRRIIKNFNFTKFEIGLKNTYDWYLKFKKLLT
jgi:UDP-glucuronate 4-epimerase